MSKFVDSVLLDVVRLRAVVPVEIVQTDHERKQHLQCPTQNYIAHSGVDTRVISRRLPNTRER